MKIGAVMFFTADSMQPAPLARLLEERGFESLWVPEHTHIPSSRKTPYPAGGPLIRPYYDIMDPFLVLNTAATVTTKLKVGTGIALLTQRDPIVTAKVVSTIDQLSQRPLPVRRRQRLEPGRDREPRHRLREPPQARARAHGGDEGDLDRGGARVSRRVRELRQDEAVAQALPEAASADHRRRRLPLCGTARHPLRQWLDPARRPAGERRRRRGHRQVPRHGQGGRPRSRRPADHHLPRARGAGSAEILPGDRRRSRHLHPAGREGRQADADHRPLDAS